MSHMQISNTLVGYCWYVVKPFIAVLVLYMKVCEVQWRHLIMGECRCAVALLWLEHVPSIGLAIGPRHFQREI